MKNIIIKEKISLIKALQLLKKSGKKCLIISNKNLKLLGTLTDGDIRNLIISGKKLNTSIDNFLYWLYIMNEVNHILSINTLDGLLNYGITVRTILIVGIMPGLIAMAVTYPVDLTRRLI